MAPDRPGLSRRGAGQGPHLAADGALIGPGGRGRPGGGLLLVPDPAPGRPRPLGRADLQIDLLVVEADTPRDRLCLGKRLLVGPGDVRVLLVTDPDGPIAGLALPRATRAAGSRLEHVEVDVRLREVVAGAEAALVKGDHVGGVGDGGAADGDGD